MAAPALELLDLHRRYGEIRAVDGVDLTVAPGERFALLGPSGAGKTTILRLVAGFEQPDRGTIRLGGDDVAGAPPERRNVGVVFQDYALFPHRTVADNIAFGLRMRRWPSARRRARVAELLDLVDMSSLGDRRPDQLSGGQRQRVAVARALAPNPDLLLLDEPLANLDRRLREALRGELVRITAAVGITSVLVTHDQEEALSFAERIGVLREGRLIQVGAPPEVWRHPADRFVATFLGDMNLLPAVLRRAGDEGARVRPPGIAGVLEVVEQDGTAGLADGTPVVVCLRPEALRLVPDDTSAEAVSDIGYVGGSALVTVTRSGRGNDRIVVRQTQPDGRPQVRVGQRVRVEPLVSAAAVFPAARGVAGGSGA